jgi:hypothetical protein
MLTKIMVKFCSTNKFISLALLTLAAVLPIQNTLIVFAVNVFNLPSWLALWKELLVVILLMLMLKQMFQIGFFSLKYVWFLSVFGILNLSVLTSSFVLNKVPINQFILGYRFESFWLWLWVIGFVWVTNLGLNTLGYFQRQLTKGIFLGFALCVILTLGQLTVGKEFVHFLGYTNSNENILLNKINSPDCHTIDFGVDNCRLSAPFSSPNHLAGYLIFILAFCLYNGVKRGELDSIKKNVDAFKLTSFSFINLIHNIISATTNYIFVPLSIILSILIFLTYSRFALIVMALYWLFVIIYLLQSKFSKIIVSIILLFTFSFSLLVTSFDPSWASKILPTFIAKPSSSLEHYRLTGVSLDILKAEPKILLTGLGQGASGSSTTYFQPDQNVIYNRFKDISYKWFIKPERITVPENWYLQLILNGGLVYTLLYIFILIYPLIKIIKNSKVVVSNSPLEGWHSQTDGVDESDATSTKNSHLKSEFYQNLFVLLSFFGIILGNIFLHLWENQTIAIYWSLIYLWWSLEKPFIN